MGAHLVAGLAACCLLLAACCFRRCFWMLAFGRRLVVGRVGGWVRWLIEVVGFVNGFAFLFLCFRGAGGNTL